MKDFFNDLSILLLAPCDRLLLVRVYCEKEGKLIFGGVILVFMFQMMGNVTTDDDVEMTADVRQMREKVRRRFRNKMSNIAMREALVSDDRISTYTNVMSEQGYIPIFVPLISIAEVSIVTFKCFKMLKFNSSVKVLHLLSSFFTKIISTISDFFFTINSLL